MKSEMKLLGINGNTEVIAYKKYMNRGLIFHLFSVTRTKTCSTICGLGYWKIKGKTKAGKPKERISEDDIYTDNQFLIMPLDDAVQFGTVCQKCLPM